MKIDIVRVTCKERSEYNASMTGRGNTYSIVYGAVAESFVMRPGSPEAILIRIAETEGHYTHQDALKALKGICKAVGATFPKMEAPE